MIKVVMTRSLLQKDIDYITDGLMERVGNQFMLVAPETYDEEGIIRVCGDADVLLGPYVTRRMIESIPDLKLIQVPWTGMDTFNFEEVRGCKVPVCNSHSNAAAVAEIGFAIALDLFKKLSYHDRKMRRGNWNRDQQPLDLKSAMMSQQTICIWGYGNIGSRIGDMFRCFGADVIAVDPYAAASEYVELFRPEQADDALAKADMVVLTTPLTEKTKGMVDDAFIAKMKNRSYLVTLSRAGILDEGAVYRALTSGKLAGYGSDVWWRAPKRGESESCVSDLYHFEKLENVVLSPHRAGFCENELPHLDDVIINLANLINNKPLINRVNVEEEY